MKKIFLLLIISLSILMVGCGKTQIQTDKDLTKAKSWTVKQATRDEVIAAGFEIATSMKGDKNEK